MIIMLTVNNNCVPEATDSVPANPLPLPRTHLVNAAYDGTRPRATIFHPERNPPMLGD
jgi:hypothetical protein